MNDQLGTRGKSRVATLAAVAVVCLTGAVAIALASGGEDRGPTTADAPTTTTESPLRLDPDATVTVLAAGDIASCSEDGDEETAALLDSRDGEILVLGDLAYENGSEANFDRCYDPTWGRHRNRSWPSPGNHEYSTDDADAYFDYWGTSAGPERRGWYSIALGAWHVVSLNSVACSDDVGCDADSEQIRWLRADLERNRARCTLAFFHHPLFSSSVRGPAPEVRPLWEALHAAGADVILTGHQHHYERFAPMRPDGRIDRERGIRSFVVGTGGRSLYRLVDPRVGGSEVADARSYGILEMTLRPDGYDWEFVGVDGTEFTDGGSDTCR